MSRLELTRTHRLATLAASLSIAGSLCACLDHPLKPIELQKGSERNEQVELTTNRNVDILFVMDNSGSMGEEQAILANNFGSFIERLEHEQVKANYRIGVTTTDNGNPRCSPGQTTPEGGNLVMSSCKDRLGDFVFNGDPVIDAQDTACNDICSLSAEQLEVLPTATDVDPNEKPRPWLENIEGRKNIPAATDTVEAFKCLGPQGINGCGFESQLESMYLSLIRADNPNEASYGFMRSDAILAVVFVTDEADCSYNKDWSEIFDADGNKVFWSNPDEAIPSSAVCWNAGVECSGDPSGYDSCEAVNKDVNGTVGVGDDEAVLRPVSRYTGLLAGIEQQKQAINESSEVIMALIGGVAEDGQPYYADASQTNPDFQDKFGIGPGCEAINPANPDDPVTAVPPVRLADVVDEFTPGNMFSVCDPDYGQALGAIGDAIAASIRPACYTRCVEDSDLSTLIVEPECNVVEQAPGSGPKTTLDECLRDANGYVIDAESGDYAMPSDAVNACFVMLVDDPDAPLTGSTLDDMSSECVDKNFNLEFKVARRPGFPAPGGTSVSATCSLADFANETCPGIGG